MRLVLTRGGRACYSFPAMNATHYKEVIHQVEIVNDKGETVDMPFLCANCAIDELSGEVEILELSNECGDEFPTHILSELDLDRIKAKAMEKVKFGWD